MPGPGGHGGRGGGFGGVHGGGPGRSGPGGRGPGGFGHGGHGPGGFGHGGFGHGGHGPGGFGPRGPMRPRPRPFFFRPWGYRRYYGPGYGRGGGCLGCTLPILLLALTVIAAVAGGSALLSGAFF